MALRASKAQAEGKRVGDRLEKTALRKKKPKEKGEIPLGTRGMSVIRSEKQKQWLCCALAVLTVANSPLHILLRRVAYYSHSVQGVFTSRAGEEGGEKKQVDAERGHLPSAPESEDGGENGTLREPTSQDKEG